MSLNRVSSLESFSFVPSEIRSSRRGSDASALSVRARKLSFNPLPDAWDPPAERHDNIQAIGAFEVPKWKRVLQVSVTVLYCLVAAGVVFGYAAIKPVLKSEGAYRDVCAADHPAGISQDTCVEIRLNLMFTVAAVGTNVAALPVGAILDHAGPRVCGLLGSAFLASGALMLAYARDLPFDGFLSGYLLLALGGPFTYISSLQLSNSFPRHSGLIMALLTGAFDASSALFLFYHLVYEWTAGSFGLRSFFLTYLAVPAIIVALHLTLLPAQSYKTVGEMIQEIEEPARHHAASDQVDEHTALLQEEERLTIEEAVGELLGATKADKQARREVRKNEVSGVWGAMHHATITQQLLSPWFILIMLFTVIQMTRINYFVATVRPQYEAIFHSRERAVAINNFFDLALPLGGIASIPFTGLILDNSSTTAVTASLVCVATAIGVLGVLPLTWAAYANVCLFVLYRPFYYTAVSDYSAKVFGFRTFGTVYGTIICLSGLFNLSQTGLDYLFHRTFAGNPVPVNLALLSAGLVVGVCLFLFVAVRTRSLAHGGRSEEQQEAGAAFVARRDFAAQH